MLAYPRVFISAGEHSGDRFGAALAVALKEIAPDVQLVGVGGPRMAGAGVRVVADTVGHAGMGFLSTFRNMGRWTCVFRRCISEFNGQRPDILVPIDNPGFNLRLAGHARERRIPVCYYVSPQVWAWRPGRIHRIGRLVDRMMTLLPFEKPLYDRIGVDCRYVGHPVLDYMPETAAKCMPREKFLPYAPTPGWPIIGLLPGSRAQEVRHTFPLICDAARIVRDRVPEARFVVGAAAAEHMADITAILASRGLEADVHLGRTAEIMRDARLCLIVSGTATLETAWFRTPMVVVYRTASWARPIVPRLLRVPHITLVNILAGREVVPEFLKFDDDARPVGEAVLRLLNDQDAWDQCRRELDEVMTSLGAPGATHRAAEAVMDLLNRR